MKPQTVIFMGPQGSGKGTQRDALKTYLAEHDPKRDIVSMQTGRRFRDLMERENYTGAKTIKNMEAGVLHPLFLSVTLWGMEMIEQLDDGSHALIDGFPRRIEEAELLEEAFTFYNREHIAIVFIDTPEDVVRERMAARKRMDDTPERIDERLKAYERDTVPILEYYQARTHTNFIRVDGTKSIEAIHQDVVTALEKDA